jgi:hypothetical protein
LAVILREKGIQRADGEFKERNGNSESGKEIERAEGEFKERKVNSKSGK